MKKILNEILREILEKISEDSPAEIYIIIPDSISGKQTTEGVFERNLGF